MQRQDLFARAPAFASIEHDGNDDHDYFEIDIGGDGFNDGSGSLTAGSQWTLAIQPSNAYYFSIQYAVVSYETPAATGEPYYPVPMPENSRLYQRYQGLAEAETRRNRVWFSAGTPISVSPSGIHTASPLQRTWMTRSL